MGRLFVGRCWRGFYDGVNILLSTRTELNDMYIHAIV